MPLPQTHDELRTLLTTMKQNNAPHEALKVVFEDFKSREASGLIQQPIQETGVQMNKPQTINISGEQAKQIAIGEGTTALGGGEKRFRTPTEEKNLKKGQETAAAIAELASFLGGAGLGAGLVRQVLTKFAPKLATTLAGQSAQVGLEGAVGTVTGEAATGKIASPGEVAVNAALGGALPPVAKGLTMLGGKLIKSVIPVGAKEAALSQRAEAGLGAAPRSLSQTVTERGLAGTEKQLGVQALKESEKIFQEEINPALEAIPHKLSKESLFTDLERKILKTKEPGRKKSLQAGLDAIKEDYANISELSYKEWQSIKSGLDEFIPQKAFKGQDIANAYNQMRFELANSIRNATYNKFSDNALRNKYLDYGNLLELEKLGIKSRQGKAINPGGTKTLISDIWNALVTPIGTVGGQTLYKLGKGLEIVAPVGAKTGGDALKMKGIDKATFDKVFLQPISETRASLGLGSPSVAKKKVLTQSSDKILFRKKDFPGLSEAELADAKNLSSRANDGTINAAEQKRFDELINKSQGSAIEKEVSAAIAATPEAELQSMAKEFARDVKNFGAEFEDLGTVAKEVKRKQSAGIALTRSQERALPAIKSIDGALQEHNSKFGTDTDMSEFVAMIRDEVPSATRRGVEITSRLRPGEKKALTAESETDKLFGVKSELQNTGGKTGTPGIDRPATTKPAKAQANTTAAKSKPEEFMKLVEKAQTPDRSLTHKSIDELKKLDTRTVRNKNGGFALGKVDKNGTIELTNVFSLQEGKGIGREAVETAIAEARNKGAKKVILDAYKYLKKFYNKFGFKITNEYPFDPNHSLDGFDPRIKGDELRHNIIEMELNI